MKFRPAVFLTLLAAAGGLTAAGWALFGDRGTDGEAAAAGPRLTLQDIPFGGARAYEYLKRLCAIGPRPSGSPGMAKQQKYLAEHFKKLGGRVEFQRFRVPDPRDGRPVSMANVIVRWHPNKADRILLCAHYDTLPFPLLDETNPRGRFVGANDNASGVAVLMELAHEMAEMELNYGVDYALFDGEEYIFDRRDRLFLGSEYFARRYAEEQSQQRPKYRYRWGVLLDMIGDADLRILQERNCLWWRDTRPLVADVWATAARLGVREFVARPMRDADFIDDHVMLHDIGRIPCIDVIDFDYPPWHTQGDTPDKCSPLSLAKVGWVVREWLKSAK